MDYFKADTAILNNVKVGCGSKIWHYTNLYDCILGSNCIVGSFSDHAVIMLDHCWIIL